MVARAKRPYISPQEYLAREHVAALKSEYHDGVIVAMAGASVAHNAIVFDTVGLLSEQLRKGSCRGFSSDMRVAVRDHNAYYYPDIVVVCGEPEYEAVNGAQSILNPTLIIEVLSDSTARLDREVKFDSYGTIPSFATYVLVAQDVSRVECFERRQDGAWSYTVAKGLEARLPLPTIGCDLPLSEIYAHVPLSAQPESDASDDESVGR